MCEGYFVIYGFKPLQYGCLQTPTDPSAQDIRFDIYVWVPIVQFPGVPERAGEARRAYSASEEL